MNASIEIRPALDADVSNIRQTYLSAFPENESAVVADLAINLLSQQSSPATLSLVAESATGIDGHIAFSPVTIEDNPELSAYILAPLAVNADKQKSGIGSKLVKQGIDELKQEGVSLIFVYGDPDYYGRFGFAAVTAEPFEAPYPLQYAFGWQALFLQDAVKANPGKLTCVGALDDPGMW